MKYFKNTELAKLYNISEKSVRNWVSAAAEGKLDLQLYDHDGRKYVANTVRNTNLIESLVDRGKKYKNTRGLKTLRASSAFYKLYSEKQIADIISNVTSHHEIPVQYSYFDVGATRWDSYTRHLLEEDESNALTSTVKLLEINTTYIDLLLEDYEKVNVIDLGVGNALPMRNVIAHLLKKKVLNRYIGIDVSTELLDLAQNNIQEWFKGEVHFEGHIRDIVYERFDDLLVADSFNSSTHKTLNLVFFLGGTLANFREPMHALSTIRNSMNKEDLLFYSKKLDSQKSRRFFELATPGNQAIELVLELLGIDRSYYSLNQVFDEKRMVREIHAKMNVALSIKLELNAKERDIELHKGEEILLWRAKHQNVLEVIKQFDINGFELLHGTRSKDQGYLLTISKVKTGQATNN